jgi:GDP-6-deoxy-D-talose 4-dehydrogenase
VSRVLVTGATGFTGAYLVSFLKKRGLDVRGLSSADIDIRDSSAVRDAVARNTAEYVVHLAGTPNLPDSDADRAFSVNVQGTVNLLEACERWCITPRKILLASSSFVYGDTGTSPAGEDALLAPTGAYGKSKLEMERAAARWFGSLPIVIVRPFNYTGIGHGERFLVPKLVRAFRDRVVDTSFVDPNAVRDYSDVRWVASVYADLLERSDAGMTVNVCSGVGTPLPELVELLEKLTGHSVAKRPGVADAKRRTALVGAPQRLLSLVGKSSPYSLSDTLRWMLE